MAAEHIELVRIPLDQAETDLCLLDLGTLEDSPEEALRFLADEERREFGQLAHPRRRREWLGARICLKLMAMERVGGADARKWVIVKDARGRPSLRFDGEVNAAGPLDCSLSHKDHLACACLSSLAGTRVGVDIEKVSPRLLKLQPAFVNARDTVQPTPRPERALALLWSVKEACSKAAGTGLGIGLADLVCREGRNGFCTVALRDQEFFARHFMHKEYSISISFLPLCAGMAGFGPVAAVPWRPAAGV